MHITPQIQFHKIKNLFSMPVQQLGIALNLCQPEEFHTTFALNFFLVDYIFAIGILICQHKENEINNKTTK